MGRGKDLGGALRFRIEDEIDVALAILGNLLGTMPADQPETQGFKHLGERSRVLRGELHELEAVGAHRVFVRHWRALHESVLNSQIYGDRALTGQQREG